MTRFNESQYMGYAEESACDRLQSIRILQNFRYLFSSSPEKNSTVPQICIHMSPAVRTRLSTGFLWLPLTTEPASRGLEQAFAQQPMERMETYERLRSVPVAAFVRVRLGERSLALPVCPAKLSRLIY